MMEKPILFSSPMIRAILDGRKSMTRRLVKPQPWVIPYADPYGNIEEATFWMFGERQEDWPTRHNAPYVAGDILWCRETWCNHDPLNNMEKCQDGPCYRATDEGECAVIGQKWKPSIFMPRQTSRISLEVTGVKVERLQDISEEDILCEGVTVDRVAEWLSISWELMPTLHDAWAKLWDSINGKKAPWDSNPFCWCVSFRRIK
jgi:hypothetical protein